MQRLKKTLTFLSAVALALAATAIIQAVEPGERTPLAAPSNPGDVMIAKEAKTERAMVLLDWDDGSFENGLGPTGGHYDGQFAMRFGGSAATTTLVPFQIRGAYFGLNSGAPGITAANVNFWHPLTGNGFPTATVPMAQAPAPIATGVTNSVMLAGPTISSANGSLLVGVGGLGTTSWFIARDTNGPDYNRDFAGSSSNNTLVLSLGPTTLGQFGFSGNYFIRLLVDGNIPVELERLSVE